MRFWCEVLMRRHSFASCAKANSCCCSSDHVKSDRLLFHSYCCLYLVHWLPINWSHSDHTFLDFGVPNVLEKPTCARTTKSHLCRCEVSESSVSIKAITKKKRVASRYFLSWRQLRCMTTKNCCNLSPKCQTKTSYMLRWVTYSTRWSRWAFPFSYAKCWKECGFL